MNDAVAPCPAQALPWKGTVIVIRPIRGSDEQAFLAFVARLEPEDLRLRFFGCPHRLTHDELVRLTQVDEARELALVAVRAGEDGGEEILGVVRAVSGPDGLDAELGIMVRSDLKSEGLGGLLLHRLIEGLAGRGPRRLIASVLHENLAMLGLAQASGFRVDRRGSDGQAVRLVLDLGVSSASDVAIAQPTTLPT